MPSIRPRLGVNVDHIATIRQARGTLYPDPVFAASLAELAGADQITVHLREDRRHIQDRDVEILRRTVTTRLNLEMAATEEMLKIALDIRPDMITLVPEKREEQTTEGGLSVVDNHKRLAEYIERVRETGAHISLFIDPDLAQIEASADIGAEIVEIHTGDFCMAAAEFTNTKVSYEYDRDEELNKLIVGARKAAQLGMTVAAGHGIDYKNVLDIAAIPEFEEFNIGHAIVARASLVGFERAVREMIDAMQLGRNQGTPDETRHA
ncbi:pyridoxine 5'-phosphate synthase [Bradymonas sediminis]|uniref:Pyridoxine 5'-phosphate synthase n=1 Tax=Bradymonas sediminis TaxID=1548548 RepID=A0A2Z4FL13_9DELT|nr:pyridoxine 5'-phosphate synthase [Bradymonas sediminis]AWV89495.1 pyridoxine 5'-phosphate synthase [Bradymonas sediminis]TDP76777.1 pyridoxine 5'-phosphate synthase [Bradymonas sediminis]